MKLSTVIAATALFSVCLVSGSAFAMDCDTAWSMASPAGDAITKDTKVPFVIDYSMVEPDNDGKITADEFKQGCVKGGIKDANGVTVKDMSDSK